MSSSPAQSDRDAHVAARTYPTAITGTWDDLERHAWYVYENLDRDTTDWEFAEAVLALLGHEKERRDAAT